MLSAALLCAKIRAVDVVVHLQTGFCCDFLGLVTKFRLFLGLAGQADFLCL